MEHEQHEAIARWERRWLNAAGLLLALFVVLIAYSLATEGGHIAQRSGRTTPEQLTSLELFAEPGVKITGFGAGRPKFKLPSSPKLGTLSPRRSSCLLER